MDRPPKLTPPTSSTAARQIFEHAYAEGNTALMMSVQMDTAIEDLSRYVNRHPEDLDEAHTWIIQFSHEFPKNVPRRTLPTETITDNARFMAGAAFAEERFLAPFLFGRPQLHEARRQAVDGVAGKSSELLVPLLRELGRARDERARRNAVGAINEQTAIALLNLSENPMRLAVPSSTSDDITDRTDLYLYQVTPDMPAGYRYPISIKTSFDDAQAERQRFPDDIVVAAADMHNSNTTISRLIVRHLAGSPGLTKTELATLKAAETSLLNVIAVGTQTGRHNICSSDVTTGQVIEPDFTLLATHSIHLARQALQTKKLA